MSIVPSNFGLLAVDNLIRGFGGSSSSGQVTTLQKSLNRISQQAANLGSNGGSKTGSSVTVNPVTVNGVNNGQVAQVTIAAPGNAGSLSLQGSVIQTAQAATLTVVGGTGGVVIGNGQYKLSGNSGSTTLNLTKGESLGDVATQVNQTTGATGVTAAVHGNNLVLTSTQVGSNSTVSLKPVDTSPNSVSGVNSGQINSFQVNSQAAGTSSVVSGNVVSAASGASLVYQGASGGTVAGTTSFQLTGSQGSSNFTITQGESLSAVASRINQNVNLTGVAAVVNGNQIKLSSVTTGTNAIVQVSAVQPNQEITTSGVNSSQVSQVNVGSIAGNTSDVLTGQVLQSATQASVTLQGSAQGTVVDNASFQLTGALGSANLSVTQGQSLSDVAAQVNSQTGSTGVVANVVSNNLVFQSSGVGSAASVGVQLTDISHTTVVSGVNSQQLTSFQANSFTTGASETLSGTVTQSATQASVTLQGSSQGNVVDSATFQLTGALGSTNVSVTQGQALSDVAAQINSQTNSTGVVASVVSNNLVFQSSGVGTSANVGVQLTNISHTTVVSGVNSQQLASFQANSFTTGASETLNGTVTHSATQAAVTLQGSSQGTVVDTATFQLTGGLGSASISITKGQALSSVAAQINAQTASTGVVASVVSNNLVFQSSSSGSAANVGVNLTNISYTTTVSGVNSQQLTSFQANSFTNGESETMNGSVTQAASAAQLSFAGSSGVVNKASKFTLTGALGSVQITTTKTETLSSLVTQINQSTATTGVQATLSGNTVKFQSVGVGSSATVSVNVTSGTFHVTGGNGSGTATGTNAVAKINGQTVTGNGNSFQFSDAKGSYSFTTASGFAGTLSAISVNSQAGQFNLAGGNGNGTANGTDAVATINGQTVTGTGNSFNLTDALGSYSFTTVAGFTGALNAINVNSQAGQFNLSGGNGDGTANGTNAVATINGQTVTGTGNSFQLTDGLGTYSFTTAAGFTGALNPISVDSHAGQFNLSGGNGNGTANGTDAVATINGQTLTGTGNSFQVSDGSGNYQIAFASGFQGSFDPIAIQSQSANFEIQGGNGQGLSQGTNLVAVINGAQYSSQNNQTTIAGTNGTYQITFAKGFVGQIDPVSVTSNVGVDITGGDQNGVAHGTDAVAIINGSFQTGDGANFTYNNNGATVTLQFSPGFQGTFDPISVNQNNQTAPVVSASPTSATNQSSAGTSGSAASIAESNRQAVQVAQNLVNQQIIQFQFDQLRNVLNDISVQIPKISQPTSQVSTDDQSQSTSSNSSSDSTKPKETPTSYQSKKGAINPPGLRISVLS